MIVKPSHSAQIQPPARQPIPSSVSASTRTIGDNRDRSTWPPKTPINTVALNVIPESTHV